MICIVAALPAEVRPLIAHYRLLHRQPAGNFPVYRNDTMTLVLSGTGKAASAAATGYLQGLLPEQENAAWLNIGIAGHATRAVGEALLAHRITDMATQKNWYPPQLTEPAMASDELLTFETPETGYRYKAMYDMEAAGFYPTACRASSGELVQSLKIISDNLQSPASRVTARGVAELIEARLDVIDGLVTTLGGIAGRLASWQAMPPDVERFLQYWRFTVTQRHHLIRLLRRWHARCPGQSVWCSEIEKLREAGKALNWLEQHLDALPVALG